MELKIKLTHQYSELEKEHQFGLEKDKWILISAIISALEHNTRFTVLNLNLPKRFLLKVLYH